METNENNMVELATIIAAKLADEMNKNYQVMPTLCLADVAKALGVSLAKMYTIVESGEIPYIKMDRLYRFKPADVNAYLEEHRHGRRK